MNTLGTLFRITTFGESHGSAMGVVVDGCPPLLDIHTAFIQKELDRRKPGQSDITTERKEDDIVEILSGVFEGKSTGTPIALLIRNNDQHSADYNKLKDIYRPSHADYTYQQKYGIRDHRGGGRASARETVNWVAAGAIAKLFLQKHGITIQAFTKQIGHISLTQNYDSLNLDITETNEVRCPDDAKAIEMRELVLKLKTEGDSVGGMVQCVVSGVPVGLGEPMFGKLNAALAHAMFSINAVKGFELGSGFTAATMQGSQHNDPFESIVGTSQEPIGSELSASRFPLPSLLTTTNHSGGIQGGISNGMPIWFNVAFKPPSSIVKEQSAVDSRVPAIGHEKGETSSLVTHSPQPFSISGRHDPCVVPRAVAVVEAMAALVLADSLLLAQVV